MTRYRRPWPEPDDDLTRARVEDLRACIAYALTGDGRLAKAQSAELMAAIALGEGLSRVQASRAVVRQ